MKLVNVVLPFPLADTFTYLVPDEMENDLQVGCRVVVPFGKRKYYTGIVISVADALPEGMTIKEIHSLIDAHPIVNDDQIQLWKWISFYYLTTLGEVYKAAVPTKLRIESETHILLKSENYSEVALTPTEKKIVDLLNTKKSITIDALEKSLEIKDAFTHVYSLVNKRMVDIREEIVETPVNKTHAFIKLKEGVADPDRLIGKAPKQRQIYVEITSLLREHKVEVMLKSKVLEQINASHSVLKGLIDKGLIEEVHQEVLPIADIIKPERTAHSLNSYQQTALNEINALFVDKTVCLLHGVTSSGKTEIYIHLIEEHLKKGYQSLYLVPEIALTTQLTSRLEAVLGDKLGVYHSKISDNERAVIWQKMLSDSPYDIIIGVRSSVFLPFNNLGFIVVDEEHESGYKQYDPSPRYHARDTAIVMAQNIGAKVLLGSATPSVESYYNAKIGKYGLVELLQRFEDIELPEIILENTRELHRKRKMKTLLAPDLIEEINSAISQKEQVILFRNRRGFAPLLVCKICGWTPKCNQCDVSLTYHKRSNQLKCHYCNKTYRLIEECPQCKEKSVVPVGMGTEKLEDEVAEIFPNAKVLRMDTDTTRGKDSYEKIINDFQNNKAEILVGTQMLSKGLDFANVSIVGIISADGLLNHPDFRSHERGFQLMMQAAGRAGRKNKQGRVFIQTGDPDQPIYNSVINHDYESFFRLQLAERKAFNYPPFCRLISIILRYKDESRLDMASNHFARLLKLSFGDMVLGPNIPMVGRIQKYYIREILLKVSHSMPVNKVRQFIRSSEEKFRGYPQFRYIIIHYDVDPQ